VWLSLRPSKVFDIRLTSLLWNATCLALDLARGAPRRTRGGRGMLDTAPLRETLCGTLGCSDGLLAGIDANVSAGRLEALALTSTCYGTGQTVTFVRGRDIAEWERPQRKSVDTRITVDHVMASAALPIFFPPVRLGEMFYGDGGVRLVAPLAPAVHLGAEKILAIGSRYARSRAEADLPSFRGPPSLAQILGVLHNAVFLDMLEQDALTMQRLNRLVRELPPGARGGLREIDLLVMRPSRDLGALANDFEPRLPGVFRFLTRRLGTRRARSQDLLSTIMFQGDFIREATETGRRDAESRMDDIEAFLGR